MAQETQKKSMKLNLTLQLLLLVLTTLVVAYGILIVALSISVSKDLGDDSITEMHMASTTAKDIIDLEMKLLKTITTANATRPEIIGSLQGKEGAAEKVNAVLKSISGMSSFNVNTFLLDAKGSVNAKENDIGLAENMGATPFFTTAWETEGSFIDRAVIDVGNGLHIFLVANVVKDETGNKIGILGFVVDFKSFADVFIHPQTFNGKGYTFIVDERGYFIAHPDPSVVLTDASKEKYIQGIVGSTGEYSTNYTFKGEQKRLTSQPLSDVPWFVAFSETETQIMSLFYSIMIQLIGIAVISVGVVTVVLMIFIRRQVIQRITAIVSGIDVAAQGVLSNRLAVKGNDELGFMGTRFNNLVENLAGLIGNVIRRMVELQGSGRNLAENVEETASTIQEINATVENTQRMIENQSANVEETTAAIQEITRTIDSLKNTIDNQAATITQSSAAIEQMVANIRSITKVTEQGQTEMQNLKGASSRSQEELKSVNVLILEIAQNSEKLQEANSLIANIASQTNLLAMNAAIEAAHAGDAGRGFAVVADEIRKLAEMSSTQSKKVSGSIKEINSRIQKTVEGSRRSSETFEQIVVALESTANQFSEIRNSMLEQSSGSQQVLSALGKLQDITREVQSGSTEMATGSEQILKAIMDVRDITQVTRNSMEEITSGTMNISSSIEQIVILTDQNKTAIESVSSLAKKFTI